VWTHGRTLPRSPAAYNGPTNDLALRAIVVSIAVMPAPLLLQVALDLIRG
jgi:hypothetical protein